MSVRRVNWKLLAIIFIGLVVLTVTAVVLRTWQKNRLAVGRLSSGNNAYMAQQWEQAASDLGKYIAVSGAKDIPVLMKFADAQLNIRPLGDDNIQQAISTYRSVLQIQPENREAARKLIQLYLETNMHSEAEFIARNQLENFRDPDIQRMLAESLILQRKLQEARQQLIAIVNAYPEDIASYEMLSGLCLQYPNEFSQEAKYWLNEAVKRNPSSALAYIIRGSYEVQNNDIGEASQDFEIAQKLDLSDTAVRLRLARELINTGKFTLAAAHLETIQKSEPKNLLLWQTWAMLASKSGSKTEMIRIAKTGLEKLQPSNLDFLPAAASLFIDGEDYAGAAESVQILAQNGFDPGSIAFLKGMMAQKQSQGYQAVKFYLEALELGNKDSRIRMSLARLLSQLGDENAAIRQMRLLISEQPYSDDAKIYLANLLLRNEKFGEAAQLLTNISKTGSVDVDAKQNYILAQIKLLDNDCDNTKITQIEKQIDEIAQINAINANLLKFRLALQCSQLDKAAQIVAELKKNAPQDSGTVIAQIDLLLAQNKMNEAKLQLVALIKNPVQSVAVLRYAAAVLDRMDMPNESRSALVSAINQCQDICQRRQLTILLAHQLERGGKSAQASELLSDLNSKFENDIVIKKELLKLRLIENDPVRAQEIIDEIRNNEGRQGTAWRYEQARLLLSDNEFEEHSSEILSLLNYNLSANPEDDDSRLLLAAAYDKLGFSPQALDVYRDALKRSPQNLQVVISTVAALFKYGQYDEADSIIRAAARQHISNPILSGYELQNCIRHGRLESAAQMLEDLRRTDPNNNALDLYFVYVQMRKNNFIQAQNVLDRLKLRLPGSPAVLAAAVELNVRQNNAAEAIALCDNAIHKSESAQAYILRGRVYQMLGKLHLARQDFEYAASTEPNNEQAWLTLARFCTDQNLSRQAAAAWEKSVAISPHSTYIQQQSLAFFFSAGDKEMHYRGRQILNRALIANPNDQNLQIWQARALLLEKTLPATNKAIELLTRISQSQNDSAIDIDVWISLCQAWLQKNEPTNALNVALQALTMFPENKNLLLLKARAEAAHTPELAIPTVRLLHEREPNNAEIAIYLANLYVSINDYPAALTVLKDKFSACDSNMVRKIDITKAIILYRSQDKQQANKLFEMLAAADPNDKAVMLARAEVLIFEHNWDELTGFIGNWCQNHPGYTQPVIIVVNTLLNSKNPAAPEISKKILQNAIAVNSDSSDLISELAKIMHSSGNSGQAAGLYKKLLQLEPDNLYAINNLAWIMCEDQGNLLQALELAEKGLQIAPDYLDLLDTRGMAYFRLGKFDKAVSDFSVCAQKYPDNMPSAAVSYFHLGRAFAALAKKEEAMRYINTAIKLNQKNGGLSANDVAQAHDLLDKLSKGVSYEQAFSVY